jgi:hypothetical protein
MTTRSVVFWKTVALSVNFHDDGSSKFILKVCSLEPEYKASQHRRQHAPNFTSIYFFFKGRNDRTFEYGNEPSGPLKRREIPYLWNCQIFNNHSNSLNYNGSLRQQCETYIHGSYFNFRDGKLRNSP